MATAKLADGELYYQVKGEGPALLLLHAGVADSRMWDPQFDDFSAHFRVARCDLRGFGRSLLPDGPFAYHEDVRDLVELLELAPAWVVGASFGAQVAVDFALAYPDLVKGLILVAPAVSGFQPAGAVKEFGEEEDALLAAGKVEEATELNLRMWVDGPYRERDAVAPAVRKKVGNMQRLAFAHPEPAQVSLIRLDPPAIEQLAQIEQPVLIISGGLDVSEFVQLGERLAEEIPGAKRIVIPDAAHMVTVEVPEEFRQLVLGFVETTEAS